MLQPHEYIRPSCASASECSPPPAHAEMSTPSGRWTLTGFSRSTSSSATATTPLPSCPRRLLPKAHTSPGSATTSECEPPALTCTTLLPASVSTNWGREHMSLSTPSWPEFLSPQESTQPWLVSATVWSNPHASIVIGWDCASDGGEISRNRGTTASSPSARWSRPWPS